MTVEFFIVKGLEKCNEDDSINNIAKDYLGIKTSQNPYIMMTENLSNIFNTLCPAKRQISNYEANAIPLEVMNKVAELETKEMFSTFEIWYDDKATDPICIGVKEVWRIDPKEGKTEESHGQFLSCAKARNYIKQNNLEETHKPYHQSWSDRRYLIARWGDELASIKELAEKAKKRYSIQEKRELMERKLDAEKKLAMLELELEAKFYV